MTSRWLLAVAFVGSGILLAPVTDATITGADAGAAPARNVAIIVYQGVELLDFAGPGEVFSSAGNGAFSVYTVATSGDPVVSQGFVKIVPDYSIDTSPKPDIVVIPGGNARMVYDDQRMMSWIKRAAGEAELTMSVCNGAIALAKTGLLDGLKATTHWGAVDRLRQFSKITVLPNERFVDNGRILSTQGVSAGIDGALHVVQRLLGDEAAWSDAHYMMYRWEPAGLSKEARDEMRPWIERDWQAVVEISGKRVAADPKDVIAVGRLGVAQEALGRHGPAAATLERAVALGSNDGAVLDALGDARFALGQFDAAARAYERELPLRSPRVRPFVQLGIAKAWSRAGNPNAALATLQEAVASGQFDRKQIEDDPDLASLHADARFAELIRRGR